MPAMQSRWGAQAAGLLGSAARWRLDSPAHEPDFGRDIALRCPRPRISGRHRCAAERGADGAARRPHQVNGFNARNSLSRNSLSMKTQLSLLCCLLSLCLRAFDLKSAEVIESDLCVYGGTSGGVAAAVQATRTGKTAVIVGFGRHLGGLRSG